MRGKGGGPIQSLWASQTDIVRAWAALGLRSPGQHTRRGSGLATALPCSRVSANATHLCKVAHATLQCLGLLRSSRCTLGLRGQEGSQCQITGGKIAEGIPAASPSGAGALLEESQGSGSCSSISCPAKKQQDS
eukprot:4142902-Amphidinium_carterae.2